MDLIMDHLPSVISFPLADEFALQWAYTMQYFRAGDEDGNLQFLETVYLIVAASNPIFPLR